MEAAGRVGLRGAAAGRPAAARGQRRGRPARPLFLAACTALAGAIWYCGGLPCWLPGAGAGGRRDVLAAAVAAAALAVDPGDARAFPNAVKKIKREVNDPKRPGASPGEIGLVDRPNALQPVMRECDNPPHCFSTTYQELDVGMRDLRPWHFSGKSPDEAMQDLSQVVKDYPPGQQGIDGGGFSVKVETNQFLYVQFESLKRGHIDDVEFHLEPGTNPDAKEGNFLVRTSSRVGFFDFGVNAVRLNRLADDLSKKDGWKIEKITKKSHPRYWGYNCDAGTGKKAPFDPAQKFPEYC